MKIKKSIDRTKSIRMIVKRGRWGSDFMYESENWRTLAAIRQTIEANKRDVWSRSMGKERWVGGIEKMVQERRSVEEEEESIRAREMNRKNISHRRVRE
jgi:hypothetical protein